MLSAMTVDSTTNMVMNKLKEYGLTIEKIDSTSEDDLFELIRQINFNRTKAINIKKTTRMIVEEYGGKVPSKLKEIVKFKGVGNKMAHLLLQEAFGEVHGIAVDLHLHRIADRLGWTTMAKNPSHSMKQLMEWLPR